MAIVLGLPKGSLQESTFALFKRAGFAVSCSSRSYYPSIDDEEIKCRLLRPQEMSRYVELGLLDAGICGYDWVYENGSDVVDVCELSYSKATSNPVRWVLAVPNDSKIKTVKDLKGKRISTEAIGIVKRYLKANGVKADVEFSWGATEVKAPELVDAIVDLTETGSSLRANNLRIVDTILTSTTRLIANKKAWRDKAKRAKIEQLKMLLTAALDAQKRVPPIADTPHSDVLYSGTVQIHRSTPLPHRSEVKSPQFPKPSDPRFQMRFLCVRNFIPNENRKLKQYAAYNFRHNIHHPHSLFNPT